MNIIKCKNNHFYDADNYQECPYCGKSPVNRNVRSTVGVIPPSPSDENLTVKLSSQNLAQAPAPDPVPAPPPADIPKVSSQVTDRRLRDDAVTVGFFKSALGTEPVVGWLVCVEGKNLGQDFKLKSGRNFIGRSSELDINIADDDSVSRGKHAIVVFEPRGREFIIQAGETKELCYLNENAVLEPKVLKLGDVITVGNTKLMFAPFCGPDFGWDDKVEEIEKKKES